MLQLVEDLDDVAALSWDVALVNFGQALAWATEPPDAPDVARLADAARVERAALAARIAPARARRAPRR